MRPHKLGKFSDLLLDTQMENLCYQWRYTWDDLRVNFANLRTPASSAPTWTNIKNSELPFFSASATNTLYFAAQIPHTWEEGTPIKFHVHAAYPSAGTGNSRWTFTYSWANFDGNFPDATSVSVTVASPNVAFRHNKIDFGELTATGKTISSILLCSISRIGGDAADTYASEIALASGDFHIINDTFGSRQEAIK